MSKLTATPELAHELARQHGEEWAIVYRDGALDVEHVPGLLALRGNVTDDGEGYIVVTLHGLADLMNDGDTYWDEDGEGNPVRFNDLGAETLAAYLNNLDIAVDAANAIAEWEADRVDRRADRELQEEMYQL